MTTEPRNDYGFPLVHTEYRNCIFTADPAILFIVPLTQLQRAHAIAAEVRARRGMVVRKGYYIDLKD